MRYKSCVNTGNCEGCALCSYGRDCHNIPIDKPPVLSNSAGYPEAYDSQRAFETVINDFPQEQIDTLIYTLDLIHYRKRAELSQTEFANKYNIPFRTYQNWENGTRVPPMYVLKLLKQAIKQEQED